MEACRARKCSVAMSALTPCVREQVHVHEGSADHGRDTRQQHTRDTAMCAGAARSLVVMCLCHQPSTMLLPRTLVAAPCVCKRYSCVSESCVSDSCTF
jgi:hypothetical protein